VIADGNTGEPEDSSKQLAGKTPAMKKPNSPTADLPSIKFPKPKEKRILGVGVTAMVIREGEKDTSCLDPKPMGSYIDAECPGIQFEKRISGCRASQYIALGCDADAADDDVMLESFMADLKVLHRNASLASVIDGFSWLHGQALKTEEVQKLLMRAFNHYRVKGGANEEKPLTLESGDLQPVLEEQGILFQDLKLIKRPQTIKYVGDIVVTLEGDAARRTSFFTGTSFDFSRMSGILCLAI
jgi:hypothetical protein